MNTVRIDLNWWEEINIPALMLFKSGELVNKIVGAVTEAQLKSFIEKNI